MTTPTLRQLDIFAQMVASGSISRCASDLGVSRDAIRQDMQRLEQRLGHRLFDTLGEDTRLTPVGHRMVEAMQLLTATDIDTWDEVHAPAETTPETLAAPGEESAEPTRPAAVIEDSPSARPLRWSAISGVQEEAVEPPETFTPDTASEAPSTRPQQVTIAAHPAIFSHFQEALDAFEQTNSDIAIALELGAFTARQVAPMLADGRVDIAYFYALGEPDALQSRYGWSEQISLYVGVDHLLADMDRVQADDLSAVAPILLHPDNALRQITDRALTMAGVTIADPVLESDNLYDVMMAVREGAGYFATFGSLARDFGRMFGIRRLPVARPLPPVEIRQAVRREMRDDPLVSALAEYLFR
ncbi:LysR substrate-binding domain-containing protein [Sphingobium sp. H39-3-25]|uniref:LysR substrate-binding domain-containing protein n=1 Tax=Sphingobium arseniciresistens TaxID=3030834 RepID=UPI0023B92ADE|nr:LysR substrate-binding domain-containing protein [Sphingobium arseniciresistens]